MDVSHLRAEDGLDGFPFVLGVSGHLDIAQADIAALQANLVRRLQVYRESLGSQIRPFVATALARGGDQLAAEAALEAGWGLIALLPMAPDQFLATDDFVKHPQAAAKFSELIVKSQVHVVCEGVHSISLDSDITDIQNQLYRNQSSYLATHSSVVMALWDGVDSEDEGCGTLFVVKTCRGQTPSQKMTWGDRLNAPLDIIQVRKKDAELDSNPVFTQLPEGVIDYLIEIRRLTERKAWLSDVQLIEKSKACLLDEYEKTNPEADKILQQRWMELDEGSRVLLRAHIQLDHLSSHFQIRRHAAIKWATALAAFGGVVHSLSMNVNLPLLNFASWVLIGAAALMAFYCLSERLLSYQAKFIDLRVLAEILRIQFYWRVAGEKDNLIDLFENRIGLSGTGFFSLLSGISARVASTGHGSEPNADLVNRCWVKGQQQYFEYKSLHYRRLQRLIKGANIFLLGVAGLGLLLGHVPFHVQTIASLPSNLSSSVMTLAVFLLALLGNFNSAMHFDILLRTYESQFRLFDAAKGLIGTSLERGTDRLGHLAHVRRLGIVALQETTEWLRHQREQSFDYKKLAVGQSA